MDLEDVASDDHSTDEEQDSDSAFKLYPYFFVFILILLHFIGSFIDDETPIASGSGPNNIRRGVPGMMNTWIIFLPDSTNDYGLKKCASKVTKTRTADNKRDVF